MFQFVNSSFVVHFTLHQTGVLSSGSPGIYGECVDNYTGKWKTEIDQETLSSENLVSTFWHL